MRRLSELFCLLVVCWAFPANAQDSMLDEFLFMAIAENDYGLVRQVIDEGADVNFRLPDGTPVFMIAALEGNRDILNLLLEKGADVDAATSNGTTSLMMAVAQDAPEVVKLLLANGADKDATEDAGWTPLMYAAEKGSPNSASVLVEAGADPDIAREDGFTALMIAAVEGHHVVADTLLAGGADISKTDYSTQSPMLVLAASSKKSASRLPLARAMLAHGADIDSADGAGRTALMNAAYDGSLELLEYLLEQGADVDIAAHEFNETALMLATIYNRPACVKAMLDAGADVALESLDGITALDFAIQKGHTEIIAMLQSAGSE